MARDCAGARRGRSTWFTRVRGLIDSAVTFQYGEDEIVGANLVFALGIDLRWRPRANTRFAPTRTFVENSGASQDVLAKVRLTSPRAGTNRCPWTFWKIKRTTSSDSARSRR